MANKSSKFVFLILLLLLQSCSGGQIGNFLESSFNNNPNKTSENDINEKSNSNIISRDEKLVKKKDKTAKIKLNGDNKPLNIDNSFSTKTYDSNKIRKTNQNYKPKSYRVFVILKKVDPSFPTENFSKVLRNGDINFEIEKIELMSESNQDEK